MRNPSHMQKSATVRKRNAGKLRKNAEANAARPSVPHNNASRSNDLVLLGRDHCRGKDASVAVVLGSRNLNVGDDIRVATFCVTCVHRSGGIAVGGTVGDCGIRIESASIQQ